MNRVHLPRFCASVTVSLCLTFVLPLTSPRVAFADEASTAKQPAPATESKPKDSAAVREDFRFALDQLRFGQYRRARNRLNRLRGAIKNPARKEAAEALFQYADELNRLHPSHSLAFEKQPAAPKTIIGLTTALSMFTVGALMADADADGVGSGVLVALVGGAGFWGGLKLTDNVHFPEAQAEAMFAGAIIAPVTAALLIDDVRTVSLLPLTSIAGAAVGWFAANYAQPSPGQMSFVSLITLMGTGSALALSNEFSSVDTTDFALGGMWLGLAASAATAKWVDWSLSRVRYVGLASALGALLGLGVQAFIDTNNADNLVRAGVLGLWAGFGVGIAMTDSMPESPFVKDAGPTTAFAPTSLMDSRGGAAPGLAFSGSF